MPKIKTGLDPRHALSFILRFLAILLFVAGVFGALAIAFLNRKIGPSYAEGISALNQLRESLPGILSISAFIQALTLCIIALLLTLLWSHSIAGPLVRFRKCLNDIAKGRQLDEPVIFRDDDQLQGLGRALSEMIGAHKDSSVKALSLLVEAQKTLDDCERLKQEGKAASHGLKLKISELKKTYLRIKDIYSSREGDR